MKDLAEALMAASTAIQHAHRVAREHNREDICQPLREAGWDVANALIAMAPNREVKVSS
jgi:hypothetical protein